MVYLQRWHGWCHMKLQASRRKFCVHHTTMLHVTSCKATCGVVFVVQCLEEGCQQQYLPTFSPQASEHPLKDLATFEKDSNFTATDRRLEHLGGANIRLKSLTMEDDGVVTCSIHFPPSKKTSVVFLKARIRVTGQCLITLVTFP